MKYEYGVEYETNGKKPDLPDGTVIEWYSEIDHVWYTGKIECIPFNTFTGGVENINKFRIVDERYKPVEVEQAQPDWYDYDKQQAISLPPVSTELQRASVFSSDGIKDWFEKDRSHYLVVAHHANGEQFFAELIAGNKSTGSYALLSLSSNEYRPFDYNREVIRKADEEKRKFVEAAFGCYEMGMPTESFAKALYDAGCRFTGKTK